MEVSYRRDLNRNYMIVEDVDISGREYTVHMIERNDIPGLLKFRKGKVNGTVCLYYEISSRQPVSRIFENCSMNSRDIEAVLSGLVEAVDGTRQFLLDSKDLILDPDYIYMDVDTRKIWLCYVPGLGEEAPDTISYLAEFILKKLDHGDRRAVELGYELYGQSEKDNFSLQDTLKQLLQKKTGIQISSDRNKDIPERLQIGDAAAEVYGSNSEREDKRQEKKKRRSGTQVSKMTERRSVNDRGKRKKWSKQKNLLLCSMIVVLLALLFGAIVWFGRLDLTQTGGLAFLLLAVIWMIYTVISGKDKKKSDLWMEDDMDAEEDEFLDALMSELYETSEENGVEHILESFDKRENDTPGKRNKKTEEVLGETRCLVEAEEDALLRLISLQPQHYPNLALNRERAVIGKRRDQVDICLTSDTISRIHAKLERVGTDWYVMDLNSMNGTFVNGERLRPNEKRQIGVGDKVSFAALHYRMEEGL